MSLFRKTKWAYFALCAAAIVLGLCLILWPQLSAQTICWILGVFIFAAGVVKIVGYIRRDVYWGAPLYGALASGILNALLGIVFICRPRLLLELFPVVIGLAVVIDSVFQFQTAFDARRAGLSGWGWILLLAVTGALLGGALVCRPFDGASALMTLAGVALVIEGVQNLCTGIYISRRCKNGGGDWFFLR